MCPSIFSTTDQHFAVTILHFPFHVCSVSLPYIQSIKSKITMIIINHNLGVAHALGTPQ